MGKKSLFFFTHTLTVTNTQVQTQHTTMRARTHQQHKEQKNMHKFAELPMYSAHTHQGSLS